MPTKNLEEDLFHVKKVLFVSHTANFSKFNRPFMHWFQEQGYTVHYASAGEEQVLDCDRHFTIPFERSPFSVKNIQAYRQLKQVIDRENYKLIHCHTPVGGVVTRLAARQARKSGTKVLYTAHGFHFFKGAPLKNWLLFYPVERWMAHFTDCLITINDEDYTRAKHSFSAGEVVQIDGVGVDLEKFTPVSELDRQQLRDEYGYEESDFVILCVAEFTANKNQQFLLKVMQGLKEKIPQFYLVFAGIGEHLEDCKQIAHKLGINNRTKFLGYITQNMQDLYRSSDILVAASCREGLPVNVIEGMASGLPVVCTDIRGHRDLVQNGKNGYLFAVDDTAGAESAVLKIYSDRTLRAQMGRKNTDDVKKYSFEIAREKMAALYEKYLNRCAK